MDGKRNPYVDATYSREQYGRDRELIARGMNPYDSENNFGAGDVGVDGDLEEDIMIDNFLEEEVVGAAVGSRARKRESSVGYNIDGYDDARGILDDFSWNKTYLRSLVARVTGNSDYADRLDYSGLRKEGHKIKGIARKIVGKGES